MFKESIYNDLSESNIPIKFCDFCAERRASTYNVTPRDILQLNGNIPFIGTYGYQGDISNICEFGWYKWYYYREVSHIKFPLQKRRLERVLGSWEI